MESDFFAAKARSLWWIYLIWLVSSALLAWWFVWVVVSGVFSLTSDQSGHLIFISEGAGKTFYPFTLAATGLSFAGVAYYIFKANRGRWWSLPLALLVALVSTIGMVNLYEQVFINLADLAWRTSYWWSFYGNSMNSFIATIVGVSWVFAALPWWRSKNKKAARRFFLAYLLAMIVWLSLGMPGVETRSIPAYVLNTFTPLFSQATLVVLVAKPLPFVGLWKRLHLA